MNSHGNRQWLHMKFRLTISKSATHGDCACWITVVIMPSYNISWPFVQTWMHAQCRMAVKPPEVYFQEAPFYMQLLHETKVAFIQTSSNKAVHVHSQLVETINRNCSHRNRGALNISSSSHFCWNWFLPGCYGGGGAPWPWLVASFYGIRLRGIFINLYKLALCAHSGAASILGTVSKVNFYYVLSSLNT